MDLKVQAQDQDFRALQGLNLALGHKTRDLKAPVLKAQGRTVQDLRVIQVRVHRMAQGLKEAQTLKDLENIEALVMTEARVTIEAKDLSRLSGLPRLFTQQGFLQSLIAHLRSLTAQLAPSYSPRILLY